MSIKHIAEDIGVHKQIDEERIITFEEAYNMIEKSYRSLYCKTSDKRFEIIVYIDGEKIFITNMKNVSDAISDFYGYGDLPISYLSISVGSISQSDIISIEYSKDGEFNLDDVISFQEFLHIKMERE